jgi:hypothetical protein
MGLDLTLCPDSYPMLRSFLAYTRLGLDRDYRVFDQVGALPARPLAAGRSFRWYGDEGLVDRTEDPYGSALKCLTAGELAGVARKQRWCCGGTEEG